MQETKHTRSMFLTRALERILADKELRRSQNAQLKKACQLAIGRQFYLQLVTISCFS